MVEEEHLAPDDGRRNASWRRLKAYMKVSIMARDFRRGYSSTILGDVRFEYQTQLVDMDEADT